jgi:hypothetical protein
MHTIDDLFEAFGGTSEVARVLNKNHSTASEIKRRASLPVRYWQDIIDSEKGRELGVTADLLVRIHSVPRPAVTDSDEAA